MSHSTPLHPATRQDRPSDGRRAKGLRSRNALLTEAVQLASVDGLEGLTISSLAERLGNAKSSVHAAFGSKEALQIAAIRRAREMLIELVVAPALIVQAGLARLEALGESWFSYLESDVFEGGCLLCSASAEMDGRPGPTRDAVAAVMQEWLQLLADSIAAGIDQGDFASSTMPDQIAFELNAIGMAANWHHQLFGGQTAFTLARHAWADALARLHPQPSPHRRRSKP
jgi:AcrR family transcriptional regulator